MEPIYSIKNDTLIVELFGEIDHHVAADIRRQVEEQMKLFKADNLIMDFSQVNFMDSSGVGMVLGRYNHLKEKGGWIRVCGCDKYVRRILYMSGVFTLVEAFSSVEEALKGGNYDGLR